MKVQMLVLMAMLALTVGLSGQGCSENYALSFDGVDDFAVIPDAASLGVGPTEPFTLEFWIRVTEAPTAPGIYSIVEKWNGQCSMSYPYTVRVHPPGNVRAATYDAISCSSAAGLTSDPTPTLTDGQWHHVAYCRDASLLSRLYIDGADVATNGQPPLTNPNNGLPLYIGRRGPGGPYANYFKGELDEMRLSLTCRYSTTFFRPDPVYVPDADTLALLHFDEGSGQVAADDSGNGNDAILGGNLLPGASEAPTWIASSLPGEPRGLVTSVNAGPLSAAPKIVMPGDTVTFGMDTACVGGFVGAPVTYVLNLGAEAMISGVTPGPSYGVEPFFGLSSLSNFSFPTGLAILIGDGLQLATVNYGLSAGMPAQPVGTMITLPLPAMLPPSFDFRLQAIVDAPGAPILRFAASNEVFFATP